MTTREIEKIVAKITAVTGCSDTAVLGELVKAAENYVLAYTNRATLPDNLKQTVTDLAVIRYNRMGTEGEKGRSEAGESYTFNDAPNEIYSVLRKNRLARVGGYAHETKQN